MTPFTIVHDAMAARLRASGFRVVDWNSSRGPQPDVATAQDLPELQLRPTELLARLGSSSCGSEITRNYQVVVNTGDLRLGLLFEQEWLLLHALYDCKYGALDELVWRGVSFVDRVDVTGSTTGIVDPATNRQIVGWATLFTITVVMTFPNIDLANGP